MAFIGYDWNNGFDDDSPIGISSSMKEYIRKMDYFYEDENTMSKEKFTPGEWEHCILGGESGYPYVFENKSGEGIAIVFIQQGDTEKAQANAALIAAAPKLYQMLKLARYEFEIIANWCEENGMESDAQSYNNLAAGIWDVLQQARGEV